MAQRAVGTKFKLGTNFVAELKSISGVDMSAETIDVTSLDSDGGYRKYLAGFKDAGEVGFSGFFNPQDPGQADVYAAFQSGDEQACSIIFPSGMGAQWDFTGVVTKFTTTSEVEDAVTFEGTVKVSGQPSLGLTPSGGLTALSLTGAGGALTPAFSNSNYEYTYSGVTAASVTVTATAANHTLKLYVDGVYSQDLTSGTASNAISLTLNVGKKLSIFATESGKTTLVYEVVVVKTA